MIGGKRGLYLFLGEMLTVRSAAGSADIEELLFEACRVTLDKSNSEVQHLVRRRGTLGHETIWGAGALFMNNKLSTECRRWARRSERKERSNDEEFQLREHDGL